MPPPATTMFTHATGEDSGRKLASPNSRPTTPDRGKRSLTRYAIELPAQPPERAPGLGCRHFAVDLHRHGDLAVPKNLHGHLGVHVQSDQERGARAPGWSW